MGQRNFLSLIFTFIFASSAYFGFNYVLPRNSTSNTPQETVSRNIASFDYLTTNVCEKFFGKKPQFNVELFLNEVKENELRNGPTITEIQDSMGNPERFLAMIEYMSRNQNYEGFKFTDLATTLEKKELIQLYKKIQKATMSGKITDYDLKSLLVKIYRITHRPMGFWKTAWKTKSLREAFDRIDDQKIIERIELSLFYGGYFEVFDVIFKDPNYLTKFKKVVVDNRVTIERTIAVGLWSASLAFGPALDHSGTLLAMAENALTVLPPYFPSMSVFVESYLSMPERNIILENGLEKGYEILRPKMKPPEQKRRRWDIARQAYFVTFVTMMSITTLADVAVEQQENSRLQVQEARQQMDDVQGSLNERLEFSKLSLEEQAKIDTDRYIESLRASGAKLPEDSPVTKKLRDQNMKMYLKVYANTK